jgi:hypothetical protein
LTNFTGFVFVMLTVGTAIRYHLFGMPPGGIEAWRAWCDFLNWGIAAAAGIFAAKRFSFKPSPGPGGPDVEDRVAAVAAGDARARLTPAARSGAGASTLASAPDRAAESIGMDEFGWPVSPADRTDPAGDA